MGKSKQNKTTIPYVFEQPAPRRVILAPLSRVPVPQLSPSLLPWNQTPEPPMLNEGFLHVAFQGLMTTTTRTK